VLQYRALGGLGVVDGDGELNLGGPRVCWSTQPGRVGRPRGPAHPDLGRGPRHGRPVPAREPQRPAV